MARAAPVTPPGPKTIMLMHFDGTAGTQVTTDSARTSRALSWSSLASAQLSTTQTLFGGNSLYVKNGMCYTNTIDDLNLAGVFTIEYWMYATTISAGAYLIAKNPMPSQNGSIKMNSGSWLYCSDQSPVYNGGSGGVVTNQWQHHALVVNNGHILMFLNGALKLNSTNISSPPTFGVNSSPLCIGNVSTLASGLTAYFQELRISNVARYTNSFTPPADRFVLD